MNIRKATNKDIEILVDLRIDFIKTAFDSLSEDEETQIRSQLRDYYTRHIDHDFIAYFAEKNNQVVSTAFLAIIEKPANPSFITGKTGTLLNVFTYPEYRRKGLATSVIKAIIDEAKNMDISSIDLSATDNGKPLYEMLGFTKITKTTPMRLEL